MSFLVGFVVLLATSGLELLRQGGGIVAAQGWLNPLLVLVVAFVCAAGAVRWPTTAVSAKHLAGFGCYRLAAAALTLAFVAAGGSDPSVPTPKPPTRTARNPGGFTPVMSSKTRNQSSRSVRPPPRRFASRARQRLPPADGSPLMYASVRRSLQVVTTNSMR